MARPMTLPLPAPVQYDTIEHSIEVFTHAFDDDPFIRGLLLNRERQERQQQNCNTSTSNTEEEPSLASKRANWTWLVGETINDGGFLTTLPGSSISEAWMIKQVEETFTAQYEYPEWADVARESNKLLKDILGVGASYLYVVVVGRDSRVQKQGTGQINKMTELMFGMASRMNLPVYGEATNPHSRDFHQSFGCEVLQPMRFGQGVQDANGRLQPGGPGIVLWPIIRFPSSRYTSKL